MRLALTTQRGLAEIPLPILVMCPLAVLTLLSIFFFPIATITFPLSLLFIIIYSVFDIFKTMRSNVHLGIALALDYLILAFFLSLILVQYLNASTAPMIAWSLVVSIAANTLMRSMCVQAREHTFKSIMLIVLIPTVIITIFLWVYILMASLDLSPSGERFSQGLYSLIHQIPITIALWALVSVIAKTITRRVIMMSILLNSYIFSIFFRL